jgi:hypothetical protein
MRSVYNADGPASNPVEAASASTQSRKGSDSRPLSPRRSNSIDAPTLSDEEAGNIFAVKIS